MKFTIIEDSLSKEIFDSSHELLQAHCIDKSIEIFGSNFLLDIVCPLAAYLSERSSSEMPLKVCFSGGQGSGKTTLSELVQIALGAYKNKNSVGFSIDDIYKTYEERLNMSETIHKLCKVRGVPGTHDIQLGIDTIEELFNADSETQTLIPSFSKPQDRRKPKKDWPVFRGRPDFIFFDAWCGGVPPEKDNSWKGPINILEKEEDPEGIWWKWSNNALKNQYQDLFSLFDILIMIEVPDMQTVFDSRWLQEQTLAKNLSDPKDLSKIMTKKEVNRFVMHYERLTHHIFKEVPKIANIVIKRDKDFMFSFSKIPQR